MASPTISCPGCGKSYSVERTELIGKKAQCKQCRTLFVITDPRAPAAGAPPASGIIEAKPASGIAARPASGVIDVRAASSAKPASGISAPAKPGMTLPMQTERRNTPAPAAAQPAAAEPAAKPPANPDEHYPDDLMTLSFTEYEARKTRQALMEALEKQKQKQKQERK